MTHSQVREPNSFGKRKEPHSIVITRNGHSRHYSVNPLYFSFIVGALAMFSVGYFAATTYLVLRDDLIGAGIARNARMQHEYEDRIAALRSNLDKITSRQLLDQQAIEAKVAELIERQKQLGGRSGLMNSIVEKARAFGLNDTPQIDTIKTGAIKPEKQASTASPIGSEFLLRGLGKEQNIKISQLGSSPVVNSPKMDTHREFNLAPDNSIFANVADAMEVVDSNQKQAISALRSSATTKLTKIAKLMKHVGANFPQEITAQIGGPFEPLQKSAPFSSHVEALDHTLIALASARKKIETLPVANPAPGKSVSSRFGSRIDPFRGGYAMHSGMDFKASRGSKVMATANGLIIHAGRKGGYGKMVEIQHANGMRTRYAHLSSILVKNGQRIKAGTQIGKVGSTGRSTGPHLHYEIRKHGVALNPKKFLNVGRKLAGLI